MTNSLRLLVLSLGCLSTIACAAEEGDDATASNDVVVERGVAGFDLDGFRLAAAPSAAAICPAVVGEVQELCHARGGVASPAAGCATLCSVPVAPAGKVAGFGFDGYATADAPAPGTFCPSVVDPVAEACAKAGGRASAASGCSSLCSVPVADDGQVAGYDFTGPVTLDPPEANGACPRVISLEETACRRISAKVVRAARCRTLCSSPIAR